MYYVVASLWGMSRKVFDQNFLVPSERDKQKKTYKGDQRHKHKDKKKTQHVIIDLTIDKSQWLLVMLQSGALMFESSLVNYHK